MFAAARIVTGNFSRHLKGVNITFQTFGPAGLGLEAGPSAYLFIRPGSGRIPGEAEIVGRTERSLAKEARDISTSEGNI